MQCNKCNAFIPEGYMYCPVCGEEIIIVSDFEIKLEDNIDTSSIANTVELPNVNKIIESELLNQRTQEIYIPDDINSDMEFDDDRNKKSSGMHMIIGIIVSAILLCIVGTCIYLTVSRYYSYDFQYDKATRMISSGDYENAIKTLKHLNSIESTEDGKILLAKCYIAMNNYDAAIAVLYDALDINSNDFTLYDMIVSCYEAQNDSRGIHELIINTSNVALADRYKDYVAVPPKFSLESGTYIEPEPVVLSSVGDGTIYYTTDGSLPTVDSLKYIGPIPLDTGTTVISAMFVNDKNIVSDIVSCTYTVELDIPDNPKLLINSGTINTPGLIGVEVPENTKVYYTGGGTPNENSMLYKGPFLMPLGESKYSFIAYNESGECSSVINANYNLKMISTIAPSVAEYAISFQLMSMGENVALNTYKAEYGYTDGNRTYYVINEYVINDKSGRMFAVDIDTGELFTFSQSNGSYSTTPL